MVRVVPTFWLRIRKELGAVFCAGVKPVPRADRGLLEKGAVGKVFLGVVHGGQGGRAFSSLLSGNLLCSCHIFCCFSCFSLSIATPAMRLGNGQSEQVRSRSSSSSSSSSRRRRRRRRRRCCCCCCCCWRWRCRWRCRRLCGRFMVKLQSLQLPARHRIWWAWCKTTSFSSVLAWATARCCWSEGPPFDRCFSRPPALGAPW